MPHFVWAGWVSSGGELFQYDKNPWFVRNTNQVRYCVLVDSQSISTSNEVIRQSIVDAINYWKKQLEIEKLINGMAAIATQEFVESASCENTDLQFQFGYGTLSKEQEKFLQDPRKYIGVSVRTEYDQINLRGKGFVYISSDFGPNAYHNSGQLIIKAWQYPKLLQYALMHELGHVFGVPHSGSGLMSEIFLDQLLYKRLYEFYLKTPFLSFIKPPERFETCSGSGSFNQKFFKLTKPHECLLFEQNSGSKVSWKISAREKLADEAKEIGSLHVSWATTKISASKPAVIVQLPPEQKVFDVNERLLNNYMIGPTVTDLGYKGFFRTVDSARTYDAYIDLKVDSVAVVGNLDDGLFPVFIYVVPTLTNLSLPTEVK